MAYGRGAHATPHSGYGARRRDSLFGGVDGGVDCFDGSAFAGRLGSCGSGERRASPSSSTTYTLLRNVGRWRSRWASFSHPYYNQVKLV